MIDHTMQEVSKEDFYAAVMNLNVHPRHIGSYPYTAIFEMQDASRVEVGRSVPDTVPTHGLQRYRYFLARNHVMADSLGVLG